MTNELVAVICCECGVRFGVTHMLHAFRQRDGEVFYCPNGHVQHYKKTDLDRAKEEIERLNRLVGVRVDHADDVEQNLAATQRQNAALRGVITRMKNQRKAVRT